MERALYLEAATPAVTVGLFGAPPLLRLPPHGHDHEHVCVLLDGMFEERHGGRDRLMVAGSVRVSPAADEHRIRFGASGGLCLLLLADPALVDALGIDRVGERALGRVGHLRPEALDLVSSLRRGEAPAAIVAESLVAELLGRGAAPAAGPPPAWLLRVRARLREAPETVARLGDLAGEADVHPAHLVRSFRMHFGCTPGEFLRRWRVERARRRIAGTGAPLARIAFASGFADQAHMTREFRRRLGITPAALRREIRSRHAIATG